MFKKILIIRIGNIGDVLFVTPVIRCLRKVFGEAQIDILTSPQGRVVVEQNPYLNNIFVYRKFHKIERWFKKRKLFKALLRNKYDLCIVFESNLEYTKFAHEIAKDALRIGVASEFAKKFLHKTKEFSYSRHAIENYLDVVSKLLNIEISNDDYSMDFFLKENMGNKNPGNGKDKGFFIVHSSYSSYLPSRAWEIEKFAHIAKYLTSRGFSVFVTGAISDKEPKLLLEELKNEKNIYSFIGKSLQEAACLIKQAKGVLCLDTGILHISRALNKPIVCLFGPSDPYHTGPIGPGTYKTIRKDFNCGPCQYFASYKKEQKEKCLDGKITPCMKAIEAEEVIKNLEAIIDG
ncbi:MAG: glycosyltransferase family 9 protein [Candidatus Omnitrophica bacterium]|nr:glycosyltransferase family 9 protein [Candidatus Omnitrophota bacterium]